MIKQFSLVFLFIFALAVGHSNAAIVYHLNILDIDYTSVDAMDQIADFEAVLNGNYGTDWILGTSFDKYDADWVFMGLDNSLIGADGTVLGSSPLENGTILEIISPNDSDLTITSFMANNYNFPESYAGSFTAELAKIEVVPIPSAILLLGGGLLGMLGIRRKYRN